jgi:hypothetical protein
MNEKTGHFKNGRWIPDPEPGADTRISPDEETSGEAKAKTPDVEKLVDEASSSVHKAIDDVVHLGRHLFGTPEGREHIEKKARKAGDDLEKAIDEVAEAARKMLKKRKS